MHQYIVLLEMISTVSDDICDWLAELLRRDALLHHGGVQLHSGQLRRQGPHPPPGHSQVRTTNKQIQYLLEILSRPTFLFSFTWHLTGGPAGPVGAALYTAGGYTAVFGVAVAIQLLAYLYMLLRLWGYQEKRKRMEKVSFTKVRKVFMILVQLVAAYSFP